MIEKYNTVTGLRSTITEQQFLKLKSPYLNAMEVLKKTGRIFVGDVVYMIAEENHD